MSLIDLTLKPHWKENLDNETYHADKSAVGSSSLRKILKSPLSFYSDFFLSTPQEKTDAMRFGELVHVAVLEGSKFLERTAEKAVKVLKQKEKKLSGMRKLKA
jgi:hypothetical protein